MLSILITLLLTTNLFAKEKSTHISEMLKSSHCLSPLPEKEQMKNFMAAIKDTGRKDDNIHGVEFRDESPTLLLAFRQMTTALDVLGSKSEPENQKDIQQTYQINPQCDKVQCAVEKIWGNDMGTKMLYILLRHKFNTSELAFDQSSRFSAEELDDVLLALEDLPEDFTPLGKENQRLTHFTRGERPPLLDDKAIATAVIMLFDNWSGQPRKGRRYTVYHELSHNIAIKLEALDHNESWTSKSQWTLQDADFEEWSHESKSCFASEYAKSDPGEDWAESMASYRYNSNTFKQRCREKYLFLKEVIYNNQEYDSAASCADKN